MPLRRRSSPRKLDTAAAAEGLLPQAALEFESPSAAVIATRVPPLSRAINLLVFLLVVATLGAAALIQIDKIVSGRGKLVAEAPNIVLQPFDQSIVESIDVRKGDIVRQGQVLARLNPTFSAADLTAMKDQVDLLSATAARLEAEIAGTAYPADANDPPAASLTSRFELGTGTADMPAAGATFRLSAQQRGTVSGATFGLVDPLDPDDQPMATPAEPMLVLHASEGEDSPSWAASAITPAAPSLAGGSIGDHASGQPMFAMRASVVQLREGQDGAFLAATKPFAITAPQAPPPTAPASLPVASNAHVELQTSIFNQRTREYRSALEHHDQTINQLELQITGSEAQARFYRERAGLAGQVEGLRQTLVEREAGSLLNKLIATDTRLSIQGLSAQAESDAAQAGRQMAAQAAERESFIQRWTVQNLRDLAETRRSLVQAEQAYAKASLHNDLIVLTAPRDAVVLSVAAVSAGSVVTSAEALIHLVPMDVPLSVEVDVAGIDSGYVRPGDEVTIKFDTLPYLQYGMGRGEVRSISADSFNPEALVQDSGGSLPTRPSTLYYKADIAIGALELHDTPPGFRLMPGMPVTADVKVGTRSILAYFVARILPVAYESIREP